MEVYTITQVAEKLNIKVHTIRYWEKHVPLLSNVERDNLGKRIYNGQDIYVLIRLKYFIEQKNFTLKGATEELMKEMSEDKDSGERKNILDLMKQLEFQKERIKKAKNMLKDE